MLAYLEPVPEADWVDPPLDRRPRLFVPQQAVGRAPVLLTPDRMAAARRAIRAWPGYAATPLLALQPLAAELQLGAICLKDETRRFGVGSFKALGASYALGVTLAATLGRDLGVQVAMADLVAGTWRDHAWQHTAVAATDGNHGRALAWASRLFGCRCTIFVAANVSPARRDAIAAYGADVVAVDGTYDEAVKIAAAAAAEDGWLEISDTAHDGADEVPRLVMEGYSTLVDEVAAATADEPPFTHVFVQAGVGGLAGAVLDAATGHRVLRDAMGVIVEPDLAGCLFESARRDALTGVRGPLATVMAGLACGLPSTLGFEVVRRRAGAFLQIPDDEVGSTLELLADGRAAPGVPPIGETGVAGLAGLLTAARRPDWRARLGLDGSSRVLVLATEGVTPEPGA